MNINQAFGAQFKFIRNSNATYMTSAAKSNKNAVSATVLAHKLTRVYRQGNGCGAVLSWIRLLDEVL